MYVVERTPALNRNAQPAEAVVAYRRRHAARHLLLVMAEEGIGRRAAAHLLDAPAVDVVPVLLQQTAVVVLHLRQPVLCVPDKRLLAGKPLVAHRHVAVGIVIEAVIVADAVHSMVGPAVAVTVALPVERGQPVGAVVAVGSVVVIGAIGTVGGGRL